MAVGLRGRFTAWFALSALAVIAVAALARWLAVPDSYGELGVFRADAIDGSFIWITARYNEKRRPDPGAS